MNLPRYSVSGILSVIGLFAVSLACLLNASSPWSGLIFSAFLGALIVAPIGVVYRRGERRALWLGVAICGWSYLVLTFGPWFSASIRPLLVTTKVLRWAHPVVIPKSRQVLKPTPKSPYLIHRPNHGSDVDEETILEVPLDVLVETEDQEAPSPLLESVKAVSAGRSTYAMDHVTIMVDAAQYAKLEQARAVDSKLVVRRSVVGVTSPFAGLWSSPPVQADDFEGVGHVFFGVVCALVGGWVSRYFYSTRDPGP